MPQKRIGPPTLAEFIGDLQNEHDEWKRNAYELHAQATGLEERLSELEGEYAYALKELRQWRFYATFIGLLFTIVFVADHWV